MPSLPAPPPRALRHAVAVVAFAAASMAAGEEPVEAPATHPKLVVVSWDGAADWVVDRLLEEERLPHLARLAATGVRAAHSVTAFPSKTAVGHAAIWTGCATRCNGIRANSHPRLAPGDSLLVRQSGFSSEGLTAEPLYVTAAKAGRRVTVLSATQSFPADPHLETLEAAGVPAESYFSVSGFEREHVVAHPRMIRAADPDVELQTPRTDWGPLLDRAEASRELELQVGDSTVHALFWDDPEDPTPGLDTLTLRLGRRSADAPASATLKPRGRAAMPSPGEEPAGWSSPFRVQLGDLSASTYFRLFELAPDGSSFALYQRKAAALRGATTPRKLAEYEAAYPGFHDPPFRLYRGGAFGIPLPDGGDGEAERRVLELIAHDTALLSHGSRFVLESWRPDILFHYSPMADDAGHTWVGLFDADLPGHDPELARRMWPFYARVYELLDHWLGVILDAAPPRTIVALVSDHGMTGVNRNFFPNRVLEAAGLLARKDDGTVDLSRTRALVPPYMAYSIWVNESRFGDGIVPPQEIEEVIQQAAEALLGAEDPENGRRPVERIFRARELAAYGLGGERGAHLLFDTAPGYRPRGSLARSVILPARPWGEGDHGFWPERRNLHAIFFASGPGLRQGVEIPPTRHVDIAPTLAMALGLPPPAQSEGHALASALEISEDGR